MSNSRSISRRRGTAEQHEGFTGANAEITVDTTNNRAVVHDGETPGGHPQATEKYVDDKASLLDTIRVRPSTIAPNGAYNWWIPNAVHVNGKSFYSYSDNLGNVYVSEFDHDSQSEKTSWIKKYNPDDHHSGAIIATENEPLVVFTHGRTLGVNERNKIYFRVSEKPLSIEGLSSEKEIVFENPSPERTHYPQPFVNGDDILIMFRYGLDTWASRYGAWPIDIENPNFGDNDATIFVSDNDVDRPYVMPRQDTINKDIVHLVIGTLPGVTENEEDVRYGTVEISSGDVKDINGSVLGNLKTGSGLPLSMDDFSLVYSAPPGTKTRLFDITSDGQLVAFSSFEGASDDVDSFYRVAVRGGSSWDVKQLLPTGKPQLSNYYLGMAPVSNSEIYIAREEGNEFFLEKLTSEDGFDSYETDLLHKSGTVLMRPWRFLDANDNLPIMFQKLSRYDGFEDFDGIIQSPFTFPEKATDQRVTDLTGRNVGNDPDNVSTNRLLGSPQDNKALLEFSELSTTSHKDFILPSTHRFLRIYVQGPAFNTSGVDLELRARLLDVNGDVIETSDYTFVLNAIGPTDAQDAVLRGTDENYFPIMRSAVSDNNARTRGVIEVTSSPFDTVYTSIRSSFDGFSTPSGNLGIVKCSSTAALKTEQGVSGIRLFASSGGISRINVLVVGLSSIDNSIL